MNTQSLIRKWLGGRIAFIMLILSLFVGASQDGLGQITACGGGVLQLGNTFDDMVPAPVPGHRSKGYWSSVPALSFSNVNDPNAIASGFAVSTTYTITWHHQGGNDYILTVNTLATPAQLSDWVLINEKGMPEAAFRRASDVAAFETDDVVLCSPVDYSFRLPWDGDLGTERFDFWITHDDNATSSVWASDVPNGPLWGSERVEISSGTDADEYRNLDKVWAVVNDDDGCQIKTNEIRISDISSIQVRVEGGASACQINVASLGLNLEVLPFDPNFTYRWYRNGVEVATDVETYPITQVGNYYVQVQGCGSTYQSNIVQVTENLLPDVTISGEDICTLPVGSTSTITSIETSPSGVGPYSYVWQWNGMNEPGLGTSSSTNVDAVGNYSLRLVSNTDDQCYRESNVLPIGVASPPIQQNVTGISICKPLGSANTTTVGLANSEAGVSYVLLYNNGVITSEVQTVNRIVGGAFAFSTPVAGVGTYSVIARAGSCTDVIMNGSVDITQTVSIQNVSRLTGNGCSNQSHVFVVDSTEPDVLYTLYSGASIAVATPVAVIPVKMGDIAGNTISFDGVTAPGNYWVYAERGSCGAFMNGSYTIQQAPVITGISMVGSDGCSNELKNIGLNASEAGVSYELLLNNLSLSPVESKIGTSGAINILDAPKLLNPGIYTIRAEALNGCQDIVSGAITISKQPNDISFLATSPTYVCGSGNIVLSIGELDVTYTLYVDTGAGASPVATLSPQTGNGINSVSFTGLNVSGTYTILAESGTCSRFLSDKLVVEKAPMPQVVNIADFSYCANETGVSIDLAGTETSINYVLVDDLGVDVQSITGDGTARSFVDVKKGTYRVEARSASLSCNIVLRSTIEIVENHLPIVDITNLPDDFCEDQGTVLLTSSPQNAGGKWNATGLGTFLIDNGDGTANFYPGLVGTPGSTYSITYEYKDGNECINVITKGATVHANSIDPTTLEITLNDNSAPDVEYCENSPTVDLKARFKGVDQFNANAIISGPGITSTGPGTAEFSPALAGLGSHTITLNYYDPSTTCSGSTTLDVTVGTPLSIIGLANEYCSSDNTDYSLTGYINGTLPPVVVDNSSFDILDPDDVVVASGIVNNSSNFNPLQIFTSTGKSGVYKVVYKYNSGSCVNELIQEINIKKTPDATFKFPNNASGIEQNNFCSMYGAVTLTSNDPDIASYNSEYLLNGALISNGFNTITSALNVFPTANSIVHRVENNGCASSSTRTFFISEPNEVILGLCTDYFVNDAPFTISASELDRSIGEAKFEMYASNGSSVSWLTDNNNNTATIDPSGHPGTNYKVVMTFTGKNDGCEQVVEQSFNIYETLSFTGVTDGEKICQASGVINLVGSPMPAGGTGVFKPLAGLVNVANGQATFDPSLAAPGVYNIEYDFTGGDGCPHSVAKTIEVVSAPTNLFNVVGGGFYCNESPLATKGVTIGLSGSTTGVTYELLRNGVSLSPAMTFTGNGSAFNFQQSGVEKLFTSVGRYSVAATQNSCNAIMNGTVDVVMYEPVLQLVNQVNVSCNGETNGSVTVNGTGGSGSYEYSIDAGASWQSSPIFSGLDNGTYQFSIRDVSLSTDKCDERLNILTVTITEPSKISIIDELALKVNVGCTPCTAGVDCEGSATISVSGGTPDYTTYPGVGYDIIWSTGGTTLTETGMPVGTHSVTVTDGNGCRQTIAVEITANSNLALIEDPDPVKHIDNVCHLGTDGSYVVLASGGSGSYEFSLTDPATTAEVWLPASEGSNGFKVTGLASGVYNIWVRDANTIYHRCITQLSSPVTIEEPTPVSAVEENQTSITCHGATDATFVIRASGGLSGDYEFSLSNPAMGASWESANNGTDGYLATGLGAGVHPIWVRDAVNTTCNIVRVDVTILDITALSYVVDEHINVLCNSGSNGRIEVTAQGGSGNYVYQWEFPLGTIISTEKFVENRIAGDYHLTIQDVSDPTNVCTPITHTFSISEPSVLSFNLVNNKISECASENNGSLEISVSGGATDYVSYPGLGYNITWSNGEINKEKIENLSPGNYTVQVTDANGCSVDNTLTPYVVDQFGNIILDSHLLEHNKCFGTNEGKISLDVSGGSGIYQFRLQGDKIIDWTNTIPANTDQFVFSNLEAGNYEVLVRDALHQSCQYSLGNFTITQPNEIVLSYDPTIDIKGVSCYGGNDGSITVSTAGGSGLFDYSLDNGASWIASGQPGLYTFSNLSTGNYTIMVKDALGCEGSNKLNINIEQLPDLTFSLNPIVTHVSCHSGNDGEVILTGQGGSNNYDYSIDGGLTWQPTGVFSNLVVGTYQFSLRDKVNTACEKINIISIDIVEPNDFSVTENLALHADVNCFGDATGSFTVSAVGGEGNFEYRLFDGVVYSVWQTSPTFNNLSAQTYQVSVRDLGTAAPAYCEKTNIISVIITEPVDLPVVDNVSITNNDCYGGDMGEIDVTVSGGTTPYSLQWRRVSDNAVLTPLVQHHPDKLYADDYKLVMTDNKGCTIEKSYPVTQPTAPITVLHSVTHITVVGIEDGSIAVDTPTGGTAPYTISWSDGVSFDGLWSRSNLASGNYSYTVTDSKNCSVTNNVSIIGSTALNFSLDAAPLNCFGNQTGTIEVAVTGGTAPFNIEWSGTRYDGTTDSGNVSDIPTNYTISSLFAGTYTVKLTDANGELAKVKTITQPNEITISPNVIKDISCNGSGDGQIHLNVSSLTDPSAYAMNWNGPGGFSVNGTVAAVSNQSNLFLAGDYYVTVSYNGTCNVSKVYTITEPIALSVTNDLANSQEVSCAGGADGQIAIVVNGGVGFGYKWYKWNPTLAGVDKYELIVGESNPIIKNRDAGRYKVVAQLFSAGCEVEHEVILNDPDPLSLNVTQTNISTCYGDNTGALALNINGGTTPYRYDYGNGEVLLPSTETFKEVTGLNAGTYNVVVIDNMGCSVTSNAIISQPKELAVTIIDYGIACEVPASGSDGFIQLSIDGGYELNSTQNYLITLKPTNGLLITRSVVNNSGLAVSEVINGLLPEHYELKVYDQNSSDIDKCVYTNSFDLETIQITGTPVDASCESVNDGEIQNINISGVSSNYTYTWSSLDGGVGFDNSTLNQAGLSRSIYRLTVTDIDRGSCVVTKDFVVNTAKKIVIDAVTTDVSCFGKADGTIQITPNHAGYDYTWSGPGITATNEKHEDLTDLIAGRYQLVVADGVCVYVDEYDVKEKPEIDFVVSYEITSCDPYQRTIVISALSGGTGNPATDYTFSVSGPGAAVQDLADKKKFVVTQGGEYTIEVFDKNMCSTVKHIVIPKELVKNEDITDVICNSGNTGSIILNLSGGSGAFNYVWTKTGDVTFNKTTAAIDQLTAGEYKVIVTDIVESDLAGSCSREWTFTVNEPQALVIGVNKGDITCNGDNNGFINLDVNGGVAPYVYNWSPVSGGIIQGSKNQKDLFAGSYSVSVNDNNNCTSSQTIVISEDAPIAGVLNVLDTECDGTNGSIELIPSGGSGNYIYNWSTSDGNHSVLDNTLATQTALTGGTYTVVVTDKDPAKSSCLTTLSTALTKAIQVSNIKTTDVHCVGNNSGRIEFDVTGGDGNYSYTWTTLEGDASLIQNGVRNQSGLSKGRYQVVINDGRTSSGTDCSITEVFEIKSVSPIMLNASITGVQCFGESTGQIYLSISGGSGDFSYNWNSGLYASKDLINVPAGNYTLVLTDNIYGCTLTAAYVISESSAALKIDVIDPTNIQCAGEATGEIQVVVSGGTPPYTYLWTGTNNPTGDHPTGLAAGTYSLSVTDANGCMVPSGNIVLTEPAQELAIDPAYIVQHVSTPNGVDGSIQVTVNGGVGTYQYQWEDNAGNPVGTNSNMLENVGSGEYNVTVTDDNGCTAQIQNIFVEEPNLALDFNYTEYHVRPCNGNANGIIDVTRVFGGTSDMSTGSPAYQIQITQGALTLVNVNALSYRYENVLPGTYLITVTDALGVQVSKSVSITEEPVLSILTSVLNDASCYKGNDGAIEVTVAGGRPNVNGDYLVEINGDNGYYDNRANAKANTAFTFSGLPQGNYTIRVTDYAIDYTNVNHPSKGNCYMEDAKLISEPEANVQLSVMPGDDVICMGEEATLSMAVSNWDISSESLTVTLYDGDAYVEHAVNTSPYTFTVKPDRNRFYSIVKIATVGNTTCLKGFDITPVPVEVKVLQPPTATLSSNVNEVCLGNEVSLSVAFTGVGPWTFTWVDSNNGTSETITTADNPYIINNAPIANAQYVVNSVSNGTCNNTGVGTVDVIVNSIPTVSLSGSTAICANDLTGATLHFDFTGQAPYTVVLHANGVEQTLVFNSDSEDWVVKPSETTTYSVKSIADKNNCQQVVSGVDAIVTVNQMPEDINAILVDNSMFVNGVCQGAVGVSYSVLPVNFADGGYTWIAPANSTIVSGNGTTSVVLDFDNNFMGGYLQVRAVNACGSGRIAELWIPAKELPGSTGIITGPTELCQGSSGFSYSIAPVANATEYRWELPTGFTITSTNSGAAITVELDPMLDAITSTIKVTPVNACGEGLDVATLNVEVYPLPEAYAGHNAHVCGSSQVYSMQASDPSLINPAYVGQWTVVSGSASIANSSQYNTTVTNLSRGDVVFRWTVSNNASVSHQCDVYSEVTIRNNALSVLATVDNSNVCNSTVELTGTAIPKDESGIPLVGTNGLWEVIEPVGSGANIVQSTDHVTQVTNLEIGRNVFRWTINQNGCPSSAEIEVYNREPSDAIISTGSYVDVCDDKVTLTAVDPVIGNGTWSLVSGSGLIATPNNFTTLVSGLKKGANVFRYTVENSGCIKSNTVTVFNNLLEVSAGLNQKICADSYILDATASDPSNGIVGQWSTTESLFFVDGQSAATEVRDLKQGDNVLTWTLTQNGCSSSANVTITNNLPSPASVGSNRDVCAYESTLQGSLPNVANGEYGYWSIIKGSGKFEDFEQADTKVSGLSHGENVFRWTVTHEECSSYADQTIRNLHVDTYAGKDTAICGKTVTLTANQPLTDDVGEWSLVAGVGGATYKPGDRNNPTILMGGLDYGTNGFIWTIISEGCASSDSIYVTNNNPYYIESGTGNKLEISAGPPISINAGSSATMSADTPVGGGTGMWSLISGGGDIVDANSAGTLISNLQRGESVFRWTVKKEGCSYWSDVTITNGEIEKAYAGRNDTVCTPEANLLANEPINALGEWSIIEGAGAFADKNKFNTKVTGLALGVNMFRWTLYNGATSDADDVIVYNSMVTAKTGKDAAICNSDEYILSGTIPTPGREKVSWSVVSGSGVFDFQTQHTTRISGLAQGENIIKYEIAYNRCRAEDYISVVNNTPTIPLAGDDVTICQDSIQLAPNTPTYGAGEWIKVSGNVDASALDNNWAKKLAPGENILHWRITNKGCALEDEIIIVNNQPTKAYAGKDNPVCDDHTVLAGNVPRSGMGSGHWELIAGSGIIADINDAGSEVTNLGPGVNRFRWTIDNNGCKSISEVNISYDHIQAFAGYEQVICGDETILEANVAYPGDGAWGIVAGGGSAVFEDQNSPTSKVTGLDPGTNTLTWTITHGKCQSVSQVIIVNDSPSKVYAGDDRSLCDENSATLKATRILDGRGTGSWTIRNGSGVFSQLDVNNPTVSDIAFGDNIYRWTVKHNECTEVDDVVISYNRIEATVGQNQAICSDEVLLEANSAGLGVGTWTIVGGTSQAVFENQNDPNTKVSKLAKGANVLKWNIDYKGCVTNAEVTITNNSPTSAYAGVLQELCKDNTLLDATPPTIGVGSWEVLMGSGTIANNSEAKSAVSGLSKGDNVFRWTVANGICTSEDVVRIVNNEPSIPYAGKDDESCSTTVELKAETPTYGSGLWSIVNGGGNFDDPTRPNAVISNLNPGENILKWTITRGQCDLDHSITIVNNAASVANAGPDIQDCKDWSMLDANTPASGLGNGQWALVSGKGEFDNVNNAKTAIRNLGFGENILKWTITHGSCFTSDLVTIFNKIPDQAAAGDDRVTCEDYAVLNANNPVDGTGTWSVESGSGAFENPHQYNTKVTDVGYGSNVYKWTIAYGDCVTEDVLVVTSNKAKPYAGEDDVTYDNFYTLKAQNPGELKGTWTVVAGGGTFDDTGFFNTTVRNLSVGKNTLRWTINTAGCVAYNDVIIEYKEVPDAGFTVDHEAGCFPFDVSFTNYTVGGNNYVWDFGDGGSSSERNPVYTYHTPGEYTAILTVAGPDGNNAIFTQVITVHDHPVANFEVEPNEVYLPQDAIQCVDLSVNATRWLWQFGDGVTSEEQNPSYIYNSEGVYTVTLTVQNSFGCENTFVVDDAVVAHLSGFLKFPTAFKPRPGGAGNSGSLGERTDVVFKPKSRDVEEFHMQIFNRWGQLIFETHDVNEGWDGNHKGQLAPQAVYVYKASGMYNNGRVFNKAGSVLLVR